MQLRLSVTSMHLYILGANLKMKLVMLPTCVPDEKPLPDVLFTSEIYVLNVDCDGFIRDDATEIFHLTDEAPSRQLLDIFTSRARNMASDLPVYFHIEIYGLPRLIILVKTILPFQYNKLQLNRIEMIINRNIPNHPSENSYSTLCMIGMFPPSLFEEVRTSFSRWDGTVYVYNDVINWLPF